jgi:hypothetical protein
MRRSRGKRRSQRRNGKPEMFCTVYVYQSVLDWNSGRMGESGMEEPVVCRGREKTGSATASSFLVMEH